MANAVFDFAYICESRMEKIYTLGAQVYASELFRKGWEQAHHKHTNVSLHSEHVAAICLWLAEKLGMDVNEERLVLGALSHDLGIIGRQEKFKSALETYTQHPAESVTVARELLPEKFDDVMEDMIRHHMWPLTETMPETREGMLLLMADKICSVQETGLRISHIRKAMADRIRFSEQG